MDALPLTTRNTNISSPILSSHNSGKKPFPEITARSLVNGFAEKSQNDLFDDPQRKLEASSRTPSSGSFLAHSIAHNTGHSQTFGQGNNNYTHHLGGSNNKNQENNHFAGIRNQGYLPTHVSLALPSTAPQSSGNNYHGSTSASITTSSILKSKTMPEEGNVAALKGSQRSGNRGLFSPASTKEIKLSVQTPKVTQFSPMGREKQVMTLTSLEPKRFSQFFDEKHFGNLRYNVESFYINSFVIELNESPLFFGCGLYFLKDIVLNLFNNNTRAKSENLLMDIISNLKLYKYQLTSSRQVLLLTLLEDIHEQVRLLWKREDLLEFQRSEILCKKLIAELRRNPQLREAVGNLIQEVAIEFLLNLTEKAKTMIVQNKSELQEIILLMRNFDSENQKQTRSAQRLFGTVNALLCCSLTLNIEYHRFDDSGYKTEVYTANNKIVRSFDDAGLSKTIGNISFLKINSDDKVFMLVQPSDYESIFKLETADSRISYTPVNTGVPNNNTGFNSPNNPSPFQVGPSSITKPPQKTEAKQISDRTPEQGDNTVAVLKEITRIYKKTPISSQKEIEDDPRPNSLKVDKEKKGMSRIKEVKQKRIDEQSANFTEKKTFQLRGREAEKSVDRFKIRSQTKDEGKHSSKSFLVQLSQISPIRAPEANFDWERVTSQVGALLREMNNNSSILEGLAFEEVTEILAPNYFAYINENQPVYYYVQPPATLVQVTTASQTSIIPPTHTQNVYCKSGIQGIKTYGNKDSFSSKKDSFAEHSNNSAYSNNLLTDRIRLL